MCGRIIMIYLLINISRVCGDRRLNAMRLLMIMMMMMTNRFVRVGRFNCRAWRAMRAISDGSNGACVRVRPTQQVQT